ncbi:asparaginase [Dictyocaulus viviparus]|uniref:Asparaginase n=1 Tax=Dictyocaulus viviparus TaxID=29172 RepID=A0A0D8YBJ4_DICVI|nr:asparaginase [Dictyocaulus viviparus]
MICCLCVGFQFDRLLSIACSDALRGDDMDVVSAVSTLEDNPLFNCGFGSNPTMDGSVECEAGFMTSDGFRFGGVGVVSRLKHPSKVARAIAYSNDNNGLVLPMVLVGSGAENWAEKRGFTLNSPNALVGTKTKEIWKKARNAFARVSDSDEKSMDTVGAVSVMDDVVEACTSSGGLILKSPGRLGQCTIFGSGTWAEKRADKCIGMTVSGCGEAITRADFSRSLSKLLLTRASDELPSEVVRKFLEHEFLNSDLMSSISPNRLYAGGLAILKEEENRCELLVFHNTPVLPFAFRRGSVVKKSLSQLPPGSKILVESYMC